MAVFRWRPSWGSFEDLEREVDRLLDSIKLPFPGFRLERQFPPINLYELEAEYLLVAELAGISPDNLELTVSGGLLTLKGERKPPEGLIEDRYRRRERSHGAWQRVLSIPDRVQEDQATAEFNDGILKIHLPKLPVTKSRQIPVVGGDANT